MHRLLYLPAALLCPAFAPPRAPQHYWHEYSVQPVAPTAARPRGSSCNTQAGSCRSRRASGRRCRPAGRALKQGIGEFYDGSRDLGEVWGSTCIMGTTVKREAGVVRAPVGARDDMVGKALGSAARTTTAGAGGTNASLPVLDVGCGVAARRGHREEVRRGRRGPDVVAEASGAGQRALAGPERHPEGRGRDEHGLCRRLLRPGVVPGERRAHAGQAQVRRGARAALRAGRRRQLRGARRLRRRRPSAPA